MMVCCDFMALSSLHPEMYVNGDDESRAEYTERYTWMYNKLKEHNMRVFGDNTYLAPVVCDPTINPMTQIYDIGSRRPGVYP